MNSILPIVVSNVLLALVLAIFTAILARLYRNPQLAHALWALVLLKLITPPFAELTLPTTWLTSIASAFPESESRSPTQTAIEWDTVSKSPSQFSEEATPNGFAGLRPEEAGHESSSGILSALAPSCGNAVDLVTSYGLHFVGIIWCAGSLAYAFGMVWRCLQFRTVLAAANDASAETRAAASGLALRMGLRRCPPLRVVDAQLPPLVWSLGFKPSILLPLNLLSDLDTAQRDAVIAHELAHVRRRDHLVRWLEIAVLIVFWWNPVAWYARWKLRESEEECCDTWVVWALPNHRRSYGQAMLKTTEFLTERSALPALAASAFGQPFLKRRIEMIMKKQMRRKMSLTTFAFATLLAVGVLPVLAQTDDSSTRSDDRHESIAVRSLAEKTSVDQGANDNRQAKLDQLKRACRENKVEISADEIDAEVERLAIKFRLSAEAFLSLLKEERGISANQYRQEIIWPMLCIRELAGLQDPVSTSPLVASMIRDARDHLNLYPAKIELAESAQKYKAKVHQLKELKVAASESTEAIPVVQQQLHQAELEYLRAKVRSLELQLSILGSKTR